jgi:hypothetical protein
MVAYTIESIVSKATTKDISEAKEWFATEAKRITSVNVPKLMREADKTKLLSTIQPASIGRMYMFLYDPKLKEVLPYYDKFPLIFPIELYRDGFLGINLHYLPPVLRARLMDQLATLANNDKYDKTTKLRISYQILNNAAKFRYFKPCVKRYLFNHVVSKFQYVDPNDWAKAVMLPTERFVGARKDRVYRDSVGSV